jgi:hypothetical protein
MRERREKFLGDFGEKAEERRLTAVSPKCT